MLDLDVALTLGTLELHVQLQASGPLCLAGPNGAGKTTLLLCILGILRPDRGRIALDGRTLFDAATGVDLPPEARRLGYLPQDGGLFPHLDVLANIAFGLNFLPKREREPMARRILCELDAEHLARRRPDALSGGEAQRVALARALATDPAALLLDEPTAELDPVARLAVRLRGRPSLVVTHTAADAQALGAAVAVLEAGRLVQLADNLDELRARPASPFAAVFAAGS